MGFSFHLSKKIFGTEAEARFFLNYYLFLAPALDANKEEDGGALEHQHKLHALRNLDILRERLLEAAVSSGLVTLPKPATTKVPLGAQLEEVKSAFVEKLDEIYGAGTR